MEIENICMKWEEEDMRSYLEQTVLNFTGQSSRNSRWKFWAQMAKNFKWYGIFEFFTIYKKIENFEIFYPPSIVLDRYWLFWTILG